MAAPMNPGHPHEFFTPRHPAEEFWNPQYHPYSFSSHATTPSSCASTPHLTELGAGSNEQHLSEDQMNTFWRHQAQTQHNLYSTIVNPMMNIDVTQSAHDTHSSNQETPLNPTMAMYWTQSHGMLHTQHPQQYGLERYAPPFNNPGHTERSERLNEYTWQAPLDDLKVLEVYQLVAPLWPLAGKTTHRSSFERAGVYLERHQDLVSRILAHDKEAIHKVADFSKPSKNYAREEIEPLEDLYEWALHPIRIIRSDREASWAPQGMDTLSQKELVEILHRAWMKDRETVRKLLSRMKSDMVANWSEKILGRNMEDAYEAAEEWQRTWDKQRRHNLAEGVKKRVANERLMSQELLHVDSSHNPFGDFGADDVYHGYQELPTTANIYGMHHASGEGSSHHPYQGHQEEVMDPSAYFNYSGSIHGISQNQIEHHAPHVDFNDSPSEETGQHFQNSQYGQSSGSNKPVARKTQRNRNKKTQVEEQHQARADRLSAYGWQLPLEEEDVMKIYRTMASRWGEGTRKTILSSVERLNSYFEQNQDEVPLVLARNNEAIRKALQNSSRAVNRLRIVKDPMTWEQLQTWLYQKRRADSHYRQLPSWAPLNSNLSATNSVVEVLHRCWGKDKARVRLMLTKLGRDVVSQWYNGLLEEDDVESFAAGKELLKVWEINMKQDREQRNTTRQTEKQNQANAAFYENNYDD